MPIEAVNFLSALLIVSPRPKALADFYREALGIPLREERHGDTEVHYGCELGDVHFAIHPRSTFAGTKTSGPGPVTIALATFDLAALVARLAGVGIEPDYPPQDAGFALMTAIRDPDGNRVELTQLSAAWLDHLGSRSERERDIRSAWRASRADPSLVNDRRA